jgi:hypothetical protein
MEYEIGDDPQGVPDHLDGDRDGGLREHLCFRKERRAGPTAPDDPNARIEQFGELA